jgi:antirestriction protein ArdC
MSKATEVFNALQEDILKLMEQNSTRWVQPFANAIQHNPITKSVYRGVNRLSLANTQLNHGYTSDAWATFKQIQKAGGQLKKGSKGASILFFSTATTKETEKESCFGFWKTYTVFNLSCVEKMDEYQEHGEVESHDENLSTFVDEFIDQCGANRSYALGSAWYSPLDDSLNLPHHISFTSSARYASTAFHELGHWSGAKSRLDRDLGGTFGDAVYGFEELVAELTSAFLCADYGVSLEECQHANYLASWCKCLREQKGALLKACSLAQKSCDFLSAFQKEEVLCRAS